MRTEIYKMEELTDSQELMIRKSPKATIILLAVVFAIISALIMWACIGEIDTYVIANGEITTKNESEELEISLIIPEYEITDVFVGQKVEFVFSAISVTDYGKIYGEITEIEETPQTDITTGIRFFTATASIEKTELQDKNGNTKKLREGMLTEVHAITKTQKIISWTFDRLNLSRKN